MQFLVNLLLRRGVVVVLLNVFLEQIGAPVPAIPTLVVAGALARNGHFTTTHVMLAAVFASLAADTIWFLLGRRYGYRILRTLCRISLSPDSCVRETELSFERWGMPSLLFAKFIPGFSTVAPPIAGALRRSVLAFLVFDGIGAFLWAGSGVLAGRIFHRAIGRVLETIESFGWWAVVFLAGALALFALWKWWQRMRFYKQLRMSRITAEELKTLIDRNEATVVDVRSIRGREREPQRIPSAILADASTLADKLGHLPPHTEIILYCT